MRRQCVPDRGIATFHSLCSRVVAVAVIELGVRGHKGERDGKKKKACVCQLSSTGAGPPHGTHWGQQLPHKSLTFQSLPQTRLLPPGERRGSDGAGSGGRWGLPRPHPSLPLMPTENICTAASPRNAQGLCVVDSPGFTLLSPARSLIHPFGLINYTAEVCAALVR